MARDDTLARGCGSGEGVVRFYQWDLPTLSFGRNEPAVGRYPDEPTLRAQGYDVVRRPTGGRAVLHHRELTYSVVAPISAFASLKQAYRSINSGLVAGLATLGVDVTAAPPSPALPPDAGPCFQAPAEGEVMLDGGKLVGSAQVRIGEVLLQHGSILIHDDQHLLDALRLSSEGHVRDRDDTPGGGADRPATLGAWLDPVPPLEAVIAAVQSGLASTLAGDWRAHDGEGSFNRSILNERRAHYSSREWTWRR